MGAIHDRLLAGLPEYFEKDPQVAAGLSIEYAGVCKVTIKHHTLTTKVTSGVGGNLSINLASYSLAEVVDLLNAQAGYTAALVTSDGERSASALLEVLDRNPGDDNRFNVFTSLLWAMTQPVAWALEDALDNLRAGIGQMSLKTAEGQWVDLWGEELYGGIKRLAGEADGPYANRILREVTRWRLNARALEAIVKEDLGIDARVTNLHDQAWVIGETPWGKFAGRKYSRTTFEVLIDGVSADLAATIDRSRAAGTLPFYRMVEAVGDSTESESADAHTTVKTTAVLGRNNVLTFGEDKIGGPTKIGRYNDNVVIEGVTVRASEPVLHSSGATDFRLGQQSLGTDYLGAAAGGTEIIAMSESALIILSTVVNEESYSLDDDLNEVVTLWFSGTIFISDAYLIDNLSRVKVILVTFPRTDSMSAPTEANIIVIRLGAVAESVAAATEAAKSATVTAPRTDSVSAPTETPRPITVVPVRVESVSAPTEGQRVISLTVPRAENVAAATEVDLIQVIRTVVENYSVSGATEGKSVSLSLPRTDSYLVSGVVDRVALTSFLLGGTTLGRAYLGNT